MSKNTKGSGRNEEDFPAFEVKNVPEKQVGPIFWFMLTGLLGWCLGMYFRHS